MKAFRIGTRGSPLALWQARAVAGLLEAAGARAEIVVIRTEGDRLQEAPLTEAGGKRLFVKEIEDALLGEAVDIAVHSAKDMAALLPGGLEIGAVLPREDPRDAIVLPKLLPVGTLDAALTRLGESPTIGTDSVRRIAQLTALLPKARFAPVRGNVETRLGKLDAGGFNALVLAAAGMRRLELTARISAEIPIEQCVPAPGQGIIAIEIRGSDEAVRRAVQPINDPAAAASLTAERAVVVALGGGCQLPLGAIAQHVNGEIRMHGVVATPDGRRVVARRISGPARDPGAVGRQLAGELERGGAAGILDEARRS